MKYYEVAVIKPGAVKCYDYGVHFMVDNWSERFTRNWGISVYESQEVQARMFYRDAYQQSRK